MSAPKNPYLTTKQIALVAVIGARNSDDTPVDLDELLLRLPYETSKESLQFSIRALVNRGLVVKLALEKRRGRPRRPVELTELGKAYAGKPKGPSFVSSEAALSDLEILEAVGSV